MTPKQIDKQKASNTEVLNLEIIISNEIESK